MVRAKVTLRPGFGAITTDDGDITSVTMARALSTGLASQRDLRSRRALGIVSGSLEYHVKNVHSAVFDPVRRVYVVTVSTDGTVRDLREVMASNYGDRAADTWMEGDILLKPHLELHLTLVSVVVAAAVPRHRAK